MQRRVSRKPEWQLKIAKERIKRLLEMAEEKAKTEPVYSKKYSSMAIKIGMRYNIRLSKEAKRSICKGCNLYLIPGINCTGRTNSKQVSVIITCKNCGQIRRFPYRKEKKLI